MQKNFSQTGKYSDTEVYNLLTSIDFFEKEFFSLDQRTLSILKSEVSRITNIFISTGKFYILERPCVDGSLYMSEYEKTKDYRLFFAKKNNFYFS